MDARAGRRFRSTGGGGNKGGSGGQETAWGWRIRKSEAVHGDPLDDGSAQPRFQVSLEQQGSPTFFQEKTSPDDQIPDRKAHVDGSPSLAAEQVELHVGNKVTRHDIPGGEISNETYVELPESEQIGVERSVTMEISDQEQEGYGKYWFDFSMENSGGLIC